MTRPGREATVFITRDRSAAQQAARRGFEARGLQDGSQRTSAMSSVRSGRSYDPTWEPDGETLASSSSGSVTQSMHGSFGGDGGGTGPCGGEPATSWRVRARPIGDILRPMPRQPHLAAIGLPRTVSSPG